MEGENPNAYFSVLHVCLYQNHHHHLCALLSVIAPLRAYIFLFRYEAVLAKISPQFRTISGILYIFMHWQ